MVRRLPHRTPALHRPLAFSSSSARRDASDDRREIGRMKAAIIGCGQIGQRHAHNFARLGYDVATWDAIADRCTASYASEACDGASLAIIATPPDIHCIGALQVYEWGVPWILIEKPLNAGPLFEVKTLSKMLDKRMVFVGYCL